MTQWLMFFNYPWKQYIVCIKDRPFGGLIWNSTLPCLTTQFGAFVSDQLGNLLSSVVVGGAKLVELWKLCVGERSTIALLCHLNAFISWAQFWCFTFVVGRLVSWLSIDTANDFSISRFSILPIVFNLIELHSNASTPKKWRQVSATKKKIFTFQDLLHIL